MRALAVATVLAWGAAMTAAQQGDSKPSDPHLSILLEAGITPDAESLSGFLDGLHPTPQSRQRIAGLIEQLGDDDYFQREAATRGLMQIPLLPVEGLREAVKSDDPEVRWRAKEILAKAATRSASLLYACFKTIQSRQITGVARPVLAAIPLCQEEYLLRAAGDALQATVETEDLPALREAATGKNLQARIAAIVAIGKLLQRQPTMNPETSDELLALMNDPEDLVRLAAAKAVATAGDRRALHTLGQLLDSADVRVRAGSIRVLRGVSGRQFAYMPYDDAEKRATAVAAWKTWIEGEGQIAALKTNISDQPIDRGRLLVCYYGQNKIVELDVTGEEMEQTWETAGIISPWACEGLPNGHRLVASHTGKFVVEFDTSGNEVWRKDGLPGHPFSVQRLDNGNTLVTCSNVHKVIEIKPDGEEAWSATISGRPMDARRLENGNTLIASQSNNQVLEIDHEGKEVWKIEGVMNPFTAQRLENGNTLVCETSLGRVVEYDPAGKAVWTRENYNSPYDAQRLANGNTIIGDSQGIREIDGSGAVVWEKLGPPVSRISRF